MMNNDELFETISVFLRRRAVLSRLATDPADKRTLAADLDCSRSTVDRAIRDSNHTNSSPTRRAATN
jgi:FixJ family two-component response regulator